MKDAISRSELLKRFPVNLDSPFWHVTGVRAAISSMDAIDVAPVVHATWIPDCETFGDDYFGYDDEWFVKCSRCGRVERDVNPYFLIDGDIKSVKQDYPYCHCGARMDGEAE